MPALQGTLTVTSDCAGMGSDLLAFKMRGLLPRIKTATWSEFDAGKRKLYRAVCRELGHIVAPVSKDITRRTHSAAPGCDIYIAGYPCPSFSALGKRKGVGDSRGLIGLHGLRYICEHRPRVCVLENVKGLLHEKHQEFTRLFKDIFRTLQYKTYAKVLNSKDYAIPQSRPRVYIVAVLSSAMQSKFRWPKPIQHSQRSLSKFLAVSEEGSEIADVSTYEQKHGEEIWVKPYILDVASSPKFRSAQPCVCPRLTRSRLKVHPSGYYLPKLRRRLSAWEAGRLQGWPPKLLDKLLTRFEPQQVGGALGDGMSINVLSKVLQP